MKFSKLLPVSLFIFFTCICASADGVKENDILSIDKLVISHQDLFFPNQKEITPDKSDIKIISSFLLSSKSGERWATITLENLSKGQRLLEKNNILAIFANGEKKPPINLKQKFSGNEIITLNLNFGISKFPILSIYTKN